MTDAQCVSIMAAILASSGNMKNSDDAVHKAAELFDTVYDVEWEDEEIIAHCENKLCTRCK